MKKLFAALPVAAMLVLSACSNNLYADVTRFHTNQPITRGTLAVVPIDPAMANSLEFRTHAETVAVQMRRLGYSTGLPSGQADYIATLDITQTDSLGNVTRPGGATAPPAPVDGSRRNPALLTTTLFVKIQRRADGAQIWEGRATKQVNTGDSLAAATNGVPALAEALFREFPGTPGVTVQVRL